MTADRSVDKFLLLLAFRFLIYITMGSDTASNIPASASPRRCVPWLGSIRFQINMNMKFTLYPLFPTILIFNLFLFSCNTQNHNKSEIESAISNYDRVLVKRNADSITMLFTPDGNFGKGAHGKKELREVFDYISSAHRILYHHSTSDTITISGNTSIQKGTFNEVIIHPENDTSNDGGKYIANWVWLPKQGWLIKRMVYYMKL